MFEKEAEEYGNEYWDCLVDSDDREMLQEAYKDGAEFGYNKAFVEADKNLKAVVADFNKANEWHYPSKGEYPKDNSFVLVWTENGGITTNYGKEYSDGIPENGLFEGIHISDVIAWKEIVLPKESE